MKREKEDLDLRRAFAPMPEKCRQALMDAARSVKEEKKVKKGSFRAILIAAVVLVATMAIAFAATKLGWVDFYADYGITVPKAAEEAMNADKPLTYQVGPMTFTFDQLMADAHIALSAANIRTTDGTDALYAGDIDIGDAVNAGGDNAVMKKYSLTDGTTWSEAAAQLKLPLYGVRVSIQLDEANDGGEAMESTLWNEDGSIVYLNLPSLSPDKERSELPVTLSMSITQFDPSTGKTIDKWHSEEKTVIAVSVLQEEKTYLPDGDAKIAGLTLDSVRAEKYATGIYLTCVFSAPDGMTEDDAANVLYDESLTLCDETGARLPEGLSLSGNVGLDSFPTVTRETMTSLDTLPERLILTYGTEKVNIQ